MHPARLTLSALVIVGLVTAAIAYTTVGAQDAQPQRMKVAVVNVAATYKNSAIYQELQADFLQWLDNDIGQEFKKLEEEYEAALASYESAQLNPNTDPLELKEIVRELDVIKEKRDVALEARKAYAGQLSQHVYTQILAAIHIVIDEIAAKEGYDLILKRVDLSSSTEDVGEDAQAEAMMAREFAAMASQATVLYFNEDNAYVTDITEQVAQSLRPRDYASMKEEIKNLIRRK